MIESFKWLAMAAVLMTTLLAGAYPFLHKLKHKHHRHFPVGEALTAGVFLGAALVHMLADAAHDFYEQHVSYPVPFVLAGAMFLFFLLLEHIGHELYPHTEHDHGCPHRHFFALLAVVMLSIHSFLVGAALGITDSLAVSAMLLAAILAHKWAASFALAVRINEAGFSIGVGLCLFAAFALMVPLGIVFGTSVTNELATWPFLEPVFSSLAAGTFLYLGTLHGLERAAMVKTCCNLKGFLFVITGFALMAVVSVWV